MTDLPVLEYGNVAPFANLVDFDLGDEDAGMDMDMSVDNFVWALADLDNIDDVGIDINVWTLTDLDHIIIDILLPSPSLDDLEDTMGTRMLCAEEEGDNLPALDEAAGAVAVDVVVATGAVVADEMVDSSGFLLVSILASEAAAVVTPMASS